MATNRVTHEAILSPDQIGDILVRPLVQQSVAGQVLGTIMLDSSIYRVPVVTADPAAAWTAEGAEIAVTDSAVDEITVSPYKLAALTIVSSELAADSTPGAQEVIGAGIVRDLARKLDTALFTATTTNGPAGLPGLTGIQTHTAATIADLVDTFIGATYAVEAANGHVAAWVCHPDTAARISSLKEGTSSNRPLLGTDVTQPGARQLLGAPLVTSPNVAADTVWGIDPTFSQLIIRKDAEVLADSSVYFSSDRVAIRGIIRAGFAFAHPGSIAKVTLPAAT